MANLSPNEKKPGGGDVTKAEKVNVETTGKTTDWTPLNHQGDMSTDNGVYDE
jgi:hypothetical protein